MGNKTYFEPKLVGNYEFSEVVSSLQKMIRRGKEYEACYWAFILHKSGYGQYLWRRLAIIACEDIGNGDPIASILVNSLQQSWLLLHKQISDPTLDKLHYPLQAVLYLCRARKSREVNSLGNLLIEQYEDGVRLEIDPVSIDSHTKQGKTIYGRFTDNDGSQRKKERLDRWFGIGAVIHNEAYPDKWEQELKDMYYSKIEQEAKEELKQQDKLL
jgi:replication-associated recombination protein RarA